MKASPVKLVPPAIQSSGPGLAWRTLKMPCICLCENNACSSDTAFVVHGPRSRAPTHLRSIPNKEDCQELRSDLRDFSGRSSLQTTSSESAMVQLSLYAVIHTMERKGPQMPTYTTDSEYRSIDRVKPLRSSASCESSSQLPHPDDISTPHTDFHTSSNCRVFHH